MRRKNVSAGIEFFETAAAFREWLEANHSTRKELWVGFHKRGSGRPSITWPESVDEALCFGWIDGVRKSVDDGSYTIRFSPRKPRSVWSAINIKRAQELLAQGRMMPAGLEAFERRMENRSGIYSYENRPQTLPGPYEERLRKNQAAWDFYQAQPPSYRRTTTWWVISAKKEETRLKRLEELIQNSARGRSLGLLARKK